MSRLLIAGAGGMTGGELTRQAHGTKWDLVALTRNDLDITDVGAVNAAVSSAKPDVVINAAAYTTVDDAEFNPEVAAMVNRDGAAYLAKAAASARAAVIHISTDYVFDGRASRPYVPDDETNPLSVYGETKLAGENRVRECNANHIIVRTSWVYHHSGSNFLRTMIRLGSEQRELRVVDDQSGGPTSAADLAFALLAAANAAARDTGSCGTFHFSNAGVTTWYGFAKAIFEEKGGEMPAITPIATSDYPTAATRPRYSVLDTNSFSDTFGVRPRHWRDALRSAMERT